MQTLAEQLHEKATENKIQIEKRKIEAAISTHRAYLQRLMGWINQKVEAGKTALELKTRENGRYSPISYKQTSVPELTILSLTTNGFKVEKKEEKVGCFKSRSYYLIEW